MSLNTCSISGKPISRPCVSRKTGHVYQKETIQKHLSTFPYCPITNQPMTLADIIDVPAVNPSLVKPNESARVFMTKLQNQYDTIVLESHYLRQALKETKQQIMHCAYQNEAANRVIGRLLKEKVSTDQQILELREELEKA